MYDRAPNAIDINVPIKAPTRGKPFYGYSEKPTHFSRILRRAWRYGGPIVVLHLRVPTEELQPMCERTVEQGPSPSLLNLFCFRDFVSFALCLCFGSLTQVSNKTDASLHVIQNILYKIYITYTHVS